MKHKFCLVYDAVNNTRDERIFHGDIPDGEMFIVNGECYVANDLPDEDCLYYRMIAETIYNFYSKDD